LAPRRRDIFRDVIGKLLRVEYGKCKQPVIT
jgi:hypothetical protein